MNTTVRHTGSQREPATDESRSGGRRLLVALVFVAAVATTPAVVAASDHDTTRERARPASSLGAVSSATAMGISVPLPPPS